MASAANEITEYHTELIDGHEITKFVPELDHARVQSYLHFQLLNQLKSLGRKQWNVLPELNVICVSDRLVPDLTGQTGW